MSERLLPEFGHEGERPAAEPPTSEQPNRATPPEEDAPESAPVPAVSMDDPPVITEESPHASRFQLILGALLGVGAVAIVAAVAIAASPGNAPDPNWSAWNPSDSNDANKAAQEIANHVAPTYHLDSGRQLVAVTGGKLEVADLPVTLALSDQSGSKVSVLEGKGVLYTLCGLGPKCSIATGKPSAERHLLLRREALELALYTFHYVPSTDYVVALLPPRKGDSATQAMFFTRDDLNASLGRPLDTTLPNPPPTASSIGTIQSAVLQRMTEPNLFLFSFEQGQNASVFLVLRPFPQTR